MTEQNNTTNQNAQQELPPLDIASLMIDRCHKKADVQNSSKNIVYATSSDAQVYHIRKTDMADFVVKAKDVPGADKFEEGMSWKLPKIPFDFFLQIVTFFRDIADEFYDDEAMVQIWWDKTKKEYFLVCPKQTTTKVHVRFHRDKDLELDPNKVIVMDIHSHNTMDAFWSGTDNADEQETRVYGVVGRIKQAVPEYRFRYSVAGDFRAINIFDVIERPMLTFKYGENPDFPLPESQMMMPRVDYPSEWVEIVREGKRHVNTFLRETAPYSRHQSTYQHGNGRGMLEQVPPRRTAGSGLPRDPWFFGASNRGAADALDPYVQEQMDLGIEEQDIPCDGVGEVVIAELVEMAGQMDESDVHVLLEELITYGNEDAILEKLRSMGYLIEIR